MKESREALLFSSLISVITTFIIYIFSYGNYDSQGRAQDGFTESGYDAGRDRARETTSRILRMSQAEGVCRRSEWRSR